MVGPPLPGISAETFPTERRLWTTVGRVGGAVTKENRRRASRSTRAVELSDVIVPSWRHRLGIRSLQL